MQSRVVKEKMKKSIHSQTETINREPDSKKPDIHCKKF